MDLAALRRWWPLAAILGLLFVTSLAATRSAPQLDRLTPDPDPTTVTPPLFPGAPDASQTGGRTPISAPAAQGLPDWIGTAALIALGDNDPKLEDEYRKLGTTAGCYDDWHEGRDPAGITTQDPVLAARLDPVKAGHRLANYLAVLTMEAQIIARACGKSHLHNLEPDDLVALTVEAAAMARVPLAGTNWIPGSGGY